MYEDDPLPLLKVAYLVNQRIQLERSCRAAGAVVNYFRRVRRELIGANLEQLSQRKVRWKTDPKGLYETIMRSRDIALRRRAELRELRDTLAAPIAEALSEVKGRLLLHGESVYGIAVVTPVQSQLRPKQISEMADQYEALVAMNEILRS
jgi:hypothetical protein